MGTYDEVRGRVHCPYCGRVQEMVDAPQTRVAALVEGRVYRVGDRISLADLDERGYLRVGCGPRDRTTILETFGCDVCGAWRWVRLEVKEGALVGVQAIRFDDKTLANTDYVGWDLAGELTDEERTSVDPAVLRRGLLRAQGEIEDQRRLRSG